MVLSVYPTFCPTVNTLLQDECFQSCAGGHVDHVSSTGAGPIPHGDQRLSPMLGGHDPVAPAVLRYPLAPAGAFPFCGGFKPCSLCGYALGHSHFAGASPVCLRPMD